MAAVIANSTALNAVVTSSTAMTAVAASSTAMAAVAASSTAMTAVAASTVAVSAIEASSTAIAALVASPLATTASYAFNNSWTTRRSGKVFMISMKQTNFGGTSYNLYARYTINGNSQISCYFADANTTNGYSVKRFMDSITNYTDYSSSGTATYVFIPC